MLAGGHYHVINRGNNRSSIFNEPSDFQSFVRLIAQAQQRIRLSILAVCVMPNHFHMVVSQRGDRDVSRWMHWLLTTHSHRHHLRCDSSGRVWQGRFKAFAIERDGHLLAVMRYVERNALRAGLVGRAEDWPWGSLAWRAGDLAGSLLAAPPVPLPPDWPQWVNLPQTATELAALRSCVNRQRPYGDEAWVEDHSLQAGLPAPGRKPGRPSKSRTAAAAGVTGKPPGAAP